MSNPVFWGYMINFSSVELVKRLVMVNDRSSLLGNFMSSPRDKEKGTNELIDERRERNWMMRENESSSAETEGILACPLSQPAINYHKPIIN